MKRILFISTIPGNMEALIDYYNKNLNEEFIIEQMNCYKFYKNKFLGKIYKLKYLFKKYDLIIADYPTEFLKKSKFSIYMDHGSGLKMMPGKDEVNNRKVKKLVKSIESCSMFIILSEREENILYSWVPYVNKENFNFKCLGQPRNDKMFDKNFKINSKNEIYKKFNIGIEEKLLLLAPTWRGYEIKNEFLNKENIKKLNDFLKEKNMTLMYRPHYIEKIFDEKIFDKMDKMVIVDNNMESDAQKVLAATDILITDFSGILTEFLIMNKPIAFLDIDVKQYEEYRGLAIDYYNNIHTPGPKVKNLDDLIIYLKQVDEENDSYKLFREEAIKYYYKSFDGNSSKRIWKVINDRLLD